MSHSQTQHDQRRLLEMLNALRSRVRRLMVLHGLSRFLIWTVPLLLTSAVLDYWVRFPGQLRLIFSISLLVGCVFMAQKWLWRPFRARLSVQALALKLEQISGDLEDRLASSICFLNDPSSGSTQLIDAVLSRTDSLVEKLQHRRFLAVGPTVRRLAFGGVALLLGLSWAILQPTWILRFVDPTGPHQWPKRTRISTVSREMTIAMGEPATVAMRLVKGKEKVERGWVYFYHEDDPWQRTLMQNVGEGFFEHTFEAIHQPVEYYFSAGDDTTRATPYTITPLKRPEIVTGEMTVAPPHYAQTPPRSYILPTIDPIAAVRGSNSLLTLTATKTLRSAYLLDARSQQIAFAIDQRDRHRATWNHQFLKDLSGSLILEDDAGLSNAITLEFNLRTLDDQLPNISIQQPGENLEVTAVAAVPILAIGGDDFGVTHVELRYQTDDGDHETPMALHRQHDDGVSERFSASHTLSLEPLLLKPGQRVRYLAVASDNYELDDQRHPEVESTPLQLVVISREQFARRMHDLMQTISSQMRQLLISQQIIAADTTAVGEPLNSGERLEVGQRQRYGELAASQAALTARAANIELQLNEVLERMAQNRFQEDDPAAVTFTGQLRGRTTALVDGELTIAAQHLAATAASELFDQQRLHHNDASDAQESAIEEIRQLLLLMQRWGDFQDIARRTRTLLDLQQQLIKRSAELSQKTLGRALTELGEQPLQSLRALAADQALLARDAGQLMTQIGELADRLADQDPASRDILLEALRLARKAQLDRTAGEAAKKLSANQTGAARPLQQQTAETLHELVMIMQKRRQRTLAQLSQRLENAKTVLKSLLEQQQRLLEDTQPHKGDAEAEALMGLAERQQQIRSNAVSARRTLEQLQQNGVGDPFSQATSQMGQSNQQLQENQASKSIEHQQQAIEKLKQAMLQLDQLQKKAEQDLQDQQMAEIAGTLKQLHDGQHTVNQQTIEIEQKRTADGTLPRATGLQLTKAASQQNGLLKQLRALEPSLNESPTFRWGASRVQKGMQRSAQDLSVGLTQSPTQRKQRRVLEMLAQMITALKEGASGQDSDFAQAGEDPSGGSGGGPAVPAAAELEFIKLMQLQINQQTKRFSLQQQMNPDDSLHPKLQTLASEQRAIRGIMQSLFKPRQPDIDFQEMGP